jgi:hypothetical protein
MNTKNEEIWRAEFQIQGGINTQRRTQVLLGQADEASPHHAPRTTHHQLPPVPPATQPPAAEQRVLADNNRRGGRGQSKHNPKSPMYIYETNSRGGGGLALVTCDLLRLVIGNS